MRRLKAPHRCDEASVGGTLYRVDNDGHVIATDEDAVALYAAGFLDADPEPDAEQRA